MQPLLGAVVAQEAASAWLREFATIPAALNAPAVTKKNGKAEWNKNIDEKSKRTW